MTTQTKTTLPDRSREAKVGCLHPEALAKGWRKVKLGELNLDISDGNYSSKYPAKTDFVKEGIPFIRADNFHDGRITWEDMRFISTKKHQELKKGHLKKDDVLITTRGEIGKIAYIENEFIDANINAQIVRINTTGKIDPRFFFYLLLRKSRSGYFQNIQTGTALQQLPVGILKTIEVDLPGSSDQKRIADILSAFDDKIELNNKISAALEQMAQAIFKEWFVNFRFPGHEKVRMVDSELGKIPEGWDVNPLGKVLKELESGSRPKGGVDVYKEGVPSVGAENILGLAKYNYSKTKFIPREFFASMRRGIIKDQDVLLYKDGAEIGRKSFFMKGFPFEECAINEHVFILRSNDRISQIYLYLWLDRPSITEAIKNLNANAAQPGINQEHLRNALYILVPPRQVIDEFTNLVMPSIEKIFDNALENQKLAALRDLLLPKLMSGEIRI